MADIVSSVGRLTDTVEEITAASAEQARGIEQASLLLQSVSVFTLAAEAHPAAAIPPQNRQAPAVVKPAVTDKADGNWTAF